MDEVNARFDSGYEQKCTHRDFFFLLFLLCTQRTQTLKDVSFEVGHVCMCVAVSHADAAASWFVFSLCWNVPAAQENNKVFVTPAVRCLHITLQPD